MQILVTLVQGVGAETWNVTNQGILRPLVHTRTASETVKR